MNISSFGALFGASLITLAAPVAQAQSPLADTVVVTGKKTSGDGFGEKSGIPLDQVPQGVQVLDAEDLVTQNVRSVGDALRSVPSANIGAPRTTAYQSFTLRVRGFLADQMRNGVRQRYFEDVDASSLSNIERIEVLKGPSSVLFGQSALGGIISVVTKRPQKDAGADVWATVGSYEQVLAGFDLTGPVNESAGLYFRLNGEVERSGTFVDQQDLDRENAAFSMTWAASEAVTAHFVSEWVERRTKRNPGLPLAGTVVANGLGEIPRERYLGDRNTNLEAFAPLVQGWVDIRLSKNWTLTPRISYSGFDSNFTQLRVRNVAADGRTVTRNGRFGKEDDNYTIAQLDLSGDLNILGMAHQVLAGVEFDRERATFYQENITAAPSIDAFAPAYGLLGARPYAFSFYLDDRLDGTALYFQDLLSVTDRWSVVAGVRYSEFEDRFGFSSDPVIDAGDITRSHFDNTTFHIGSTYRLNDRWSAYGGYATGFDIENTTGASNANGRPFDPEESKQYEAGIRFQGSRARGSASIFQIQRLNLLTPDPVNPDFSIQTGEVTVRGLELEGEWRPTPELTVQGGYAYLDSEITKSNNGDAGQQLADTPKTQANLFVTYRWPHTPIELRAGANYVGERPFSNAGVDVFNGILASSVRLPDYVTVNLGAAAALGDVRFDLALTSILDETYYTRESNDFSVLPGEPRQLSLRISRHF